MSANPFDVLEVGDEEDVAGKKVDTGKAGGAAAKKTGAPIGANQHRPKKREFDRHSGTGRGKEVKKDGHGRYGWGSEKNPTEEMEASGRTDAPADDDADAPAAADAEDDVKSVTYEEYLKRKEAEMPQDDREAKGRKPEVAQKFGKGQVFQKNEETVLFPDLVKGKSSGKKKDKGKKGLSLDEFVAKNGGPLPPPRVESEERRGDGAGRGRGRGDGRGRGRGRGAGGDRGRGGDDRGAGAERGGRGRGRGRGGGGDRGGRGRGGAFRGGDRGGRGGRGGSRGGRGNVNVNSEADFPSLGQ